MQRCAWRWQGEPPARSPERGADDTSISDRTWVLLTEAVDGGWGLAGHAHTNTELVEAARAEIAELSSKKANGT